MYKRGLRFKYLVGDFETTVFKGQEHTEVWASAIVELGSEDVKIFHSIDETYDYLVSLNHNVCVYYHNLKFDGSFWLSYLINIKHYKQAYYQDPNDINKFAWIDDRGMSNRTFQYSISDLGQWYRITIKDKGHIIELRDSLKLLPFSVKKIGKSFGTKHKKLEMEYKGYRYAGCEITDDEKKYIANDVLVVKEALEIMFNEGHKKLTIGSCCLAEYKKSLPKGYYYKMFPDVYDMPIDSCYGKPTVGDYIHQSYRGGWCYVVDGKENKLYHNGVTADVNSLYPSMMSSESGNRYPIGKPTFWKGDYIPDEALDPHHYYFIRIRTKFNLKEGYLPFIQAKNTLRYKGTEMLKTSDIKDPATGKYYRYYTDLDGSIKEAEMVMTLTMTDWILIKEHYDLIDCEILDGCWFETGLGIFDDYIEKYKRIKLTSKGAQRELAKLFLNNLYGKMASSKNSSFKVAFPKEDGSLGFYTVVANDKQAGYIPVGSAITSYARNFTIRTAQKNYYGADKRGFIYADTDSIHCDLKPEELVDVPVHPTAFCHWKLESLWDTGWFVRQKTYIERITHEDLEPIDKPYYNVKCAGMPERCKQLFIASMTGETIDTHTEDEVEFLKTKRELTDFNVGLCVPSKLMPKRIDGGVILADTFYEMR